MDKLTNINTANASTTDKTRASYSANDKSLPHMKYAEKQLSSLSETLEDEKVSISQEALTKLRQNSTEQSKGKSIEEQVNDKALENIKEQIEQLKQKLSRIKHEKTEEAQQQRKQLQYQISALNATMLDLLGKKLNALS